MDTLPRLVRRAEKEIPDLAVRYSAGAAWHLPH
jgi:hypothetical protein